MDPLFKQTTIFPYEMAYKVVTQRAEHWIQRLVGCGRRELWVLLCVNDEQLSQRQIGETLQLGANSIVKILDKMETACLLSRVRRPSDRREHIVEITAKGRGVMDKYLKERPEGVRLVFSPLNDEQIAAWKAMALEVVTQAAPGGVNMDDSDS